MKKFTLGYQILVSIVLGIFCGLFFGPLCSILKPIAVGFEMLIQMAVLPYLCFSLIHGLGSMQPSIGAKLFKRGVPFLFLLWAIMYTYIFLLAYIIPTSNVGLVSTGSPGESLTQIVLTYVVPKNLFYDLVNSTVPAIVVFSVLFGFALMHIEKKEIFCGFLAWMIQALEKIFYWIAAISPIGTFAHLAVVLGTVHFEDLYKLQFYIFAYIFTALLITFWVLPMLLCSFTRLSYSDILKMFRAVCLVPFALGISSVSVPFLYAYLRKLFVGQKNMRKHVQESSQIILPVAFGFGQIGNCMILFFILFLSFYYRHPFSAEDWHFLTLLMIPISLGSTSASIGAASFLIKQLKFPEGALQLYIETSSITHNFQALMSVASVVTLIVLIVYAFYGLLEMKWKSFAIRVGGLFALLAISISFAKHHIPLEDHYQDLYLNLRMAGAIDNQVPSRIVQEGEGTTRTSYTSYTSYTYGSTAPLQQILKTRVLKVGYDDVEIPYAYRNFHNELVGYDIAYAYELAKDLDCQLEFVPIQFDRLGQQLKEGAYDIAMSSIVMIEDRLHVMDFSAPYSVQDNVLIVPTANQDLFLDLEGLIERQGVKILSGGAYANIAKRHFPNATILVSDNLDPLLSGEADAALWSYISTFVWCLSHPEYIGIDYRGEIGKTFLTYPIRQGSRAFRSFLNHWLLLKDQSGFRKEMYEYWIEGKSLKPQEPRWSILRDVLHVY